MRPDDREFIKNIKDKSEIFLDMWKFKDQRILKIIRAPTSKHLQHIFIDYVNWMDIGINNFAKNTFSNNSYAVKSVESFNFSFYKNTKIINIDVLNSFLVNCIPESLKTLKLEWSNPKYPINPYIHNILSLKNNITEELSLNYFKITKFEKQQLLFLFGEDKVTLGGKNSIDNL